MYLGWDVEAVAFLGIELRGVKDDGDLPLEDHEDHRVLVRAAHPLGAVPLDTEEGQQVVRGAESSSILGNELIIYIIFQND